MSEEQRDEKLAVTAAAIMGVLSQSGLGTPEVLGLLEATKFGLLYANMERSQCSTTDSSGQS